MEAVQSTGMKEQTFTTKQQPPWRLLFLAHDILYIRKTAHAAFICRVQIQIHVPQSSGQ